MPEPSRLDRLEALVEAMTLDTQQQKIAQAQMREQMQEQYQQTQAQMQQMREQMREQYQQTQARMDQQYQQTQEQYRQTQAQMQEQQRRLDQNSRDIRDSMVEIVDMLATMGEHIEENSTYIRGLQAENRHILGILLEQRRQDGDNGSNGA